MKFDMGQQTLGTLAKQTSGASEDLGALIKALIAAAEPLTGKFNGAGKTAFDSFKARADGITAELNASLRAILGGVQGMDTAFIQGEQEQAQNAQQNLRAANFDAARFNRA
ncbi:hypothetical protein C3Y87_20800 [Carbonactinospora thermoautotrophica]|uniref:hypothetical protein n=1 Tax=Carbonactinospora thermoautotrophica TaxID=1469144 RepID=UPI00226DBCB5|nr:hypothetical protein [Carbonactinospora thermoautotrophica]MCX9193770.1 hypothetical protein [Carbonactinospora thermoautotrophica]